MDEARRTSFDRNAALYESVRPSYPDELVASIAGRIAGRRALEIGAGSGKATAVFARHGFEVTALEPGPNLAALLRARVSGIEIVESTFEAWSGSGFDLVYAAQAIHWVDPAVRYVKAADVLHRGGALAILRNEKGEMERELRRELDAAYARWHPDATDLRGIERTRAQYTAEIAASGRFGPIDVTTYAWTERCDRARYLALLDTYSDHAVLDGEHRAGLYAEIGAAIDRRGTIEIPYVSMLFFAKLS